MIQLLRNRRGSALVEYALIVAGVALVGAAAVSVFGHKTNDLMAASAAILPGAHEGDNGPIGSGSLIETTEFAAGGDPISVDTAAITANEGTGRLGISLLGAGTAEGVGGLVTEF